MELIDGKALCASCERDDTPGGKEMCVTIDGTHHHVLICVECHLRELGGTFAATVNLLAHQQKTIEKLTKKPKLGVVQ